MAAAPHLEPGKYVVHKNSHFQGVSVRSDGEMSLHVSHRTHEQVCFRSFDCSQYRVFKVVDECMIGSEMSTRDLEGGGVFDIANALTGDVITSVDLDDIVEVLPQLRVHFWEKFRRPPFSVAFTSGHNMLHDADVTRNIDPVNGIAAALAPIVSSWGKELEEAVRGNDPQETMAILKRGQDPNALVFNINDNRIESPLLVGLRTASSAAVQVLLQGRADPNFATGRQRPLLFAVQCADPSATDVLELLLRHGADPNIADGWISPIELASMKNNLNMVKLLLEAGANPLQVGAEWDNSFISAEPESSTLRLIMDNCWSRIMPQDVIFRHFNVLDDFVPSCDIRFASKGCYFQVAYYHPLPLARRLCLPRDAYGGACPVKHGSEAGNILKFTSTDNTRCPFFGFFVWESLVCVSLRAKKMKLMMLLTEMTSCVLCLRVNLEP